MRYFEKLRIDFIDNFIFYFGYINRADIMNEFGISQPQASKDLRTYMEMNPDKIFYNVKAKRYEIKRSVERKNIKTAKTI